jgi:hypothetical protein
VKIFFRRNIAYSWGSGNARLWLTKRPLQRCVALATGEKSH